MSCTEESPEVRKAHEKDVAGFTAFLNGRDGEAEALFLAAIEGMREADYEGIFLAGSLGHLAFLYYVNHRPAEAEKYFREALEAHQKLSFADGFGASVVLGHFGDFCRRQKNFQQAEGLFGQSIALCEGAMGENNRFLPGVCLNSYSELLEETGRVEEAEAVRARIAVIEGEQGAGGG